MKIEVIGTGSSGNAFLFDETIMIDIGLPYSKLKDAAKNVSHVLLTHVHGDHLNVSSARKMAVNTEAIFVCGEFLAPTILKIGIDEDRIMIVEAGRVYNMGNYKVSPVSLYHDVENFGYRIATDDHRHFHATDTATLDGITAHGYDSATIECNHDEERALELIDEAKESGEFCHLQGAMNSHLSVQQAIKFCKDNKIKKLIPVHIGGSTRKEVVESLKGVR